MKRKVTNKIPLVWIISQGCAKNLVDTELAAGSFLCSGFGIAGSEDEADIFFLNTCAFLQSARDEAARTIRAAARWKKKDAGRRIVVGGCICSWDKDGSFRKDCPWVDRWTGISEPTELGRIFQEVLASGGQGNEIPPVNDFTCGAVDGPRMLLTGGNYAYLRIADGCRNCCSYCLIPTIRGPLRSRKFDSVIREAEDLLAGGTKEIIVIAQDTSAYGVDLGESAPKLPELLKALDALPGDFRLRVMYLHPAGVTDDLIRVMKGMKHLLPCLEMPLQHISDPVLKAMNRHLPEAETRRVVAKLEKAGFALRTTFMVGFPGETKEDFEKLLAYVNEGHFLRLGVFPYSPEAGTPGAEMPGRPSKRIALAREKAIMEAQSKISLANNRAMIGKTIPVFVDAKLPRRAALGRTAYDAPDIDNCVHVKGCPSTVEEGMTVAVRIDSAEEYDVYGSYIGETSKPERSAQQ